MRFRPLDKGIDPLAGRGGEGILTDHRDKSSFLRPVLARNPGVPHPGVVVETNHSPEVAAEAEGCGSHTPPPAPPLPPLPMVGPPAPPLPPIPTVALPTLVTGVELDQDEDISLTMDNGGMEEFDQDFSLDEMSLQRKEDRLPFQVQIFPDPVEVVLGPGCSLHCLHDGQEKERLPSIVVEPTAVGEVESGELRWPPEDMDFEEDEDLFLEQCIPPANIADWGAEEEEEETSVILNHHQNTSLIDLQCDAFRDDTPTLPPESAPTRGH